MKVYVASSWRNSKQPHVVQALKAAGHEVYDFRHPEPGDNGFHWSEIDREWRNWTPWQFQQALSHPIAESGYSKDKAAVDWADACVYVLPCGRSASWEAGWIAGSGRPVAILLADGEPELMFKMATTTCLDIEEVLAWLDRLTNAISPTEETTMSENVCPMYEGRPHQWVRIDDGSAWCDVCKQPRDVTTETEDPQ